jgi:hypothetical protein
MCFDLEAQENRMLRYIGRRHDATIGFEGRDENGVKFMSGGYPSTDKPQVVPARGEYLLACRDGDLWAADQATADYCGVKFDPTFGGEREAPAAKTASK